jgi:hypothetical protein
MIKYIVDIYARMEFEIEADDDSCVNNEASHYVKEHMNDFDWNFNSIKNTETNKEI